MSRFEELARLKKSIRKNRFECIGSMQEGVDFMCDAETALPWLIKIAEAFQPGDAERLALLVLNEQQRWTDDRWQAAIDCLRRLQAAAEEIEHDA